ncbi:MAG: V-type ATP synthase subunit F [Asgard group archaeon]|nr:V-type ATP synthase subunit F [Asgard group archaeon]
MKIVSLTNAQVAMGLRLGGIKECYIADNPPEAVDKLQELSNNKEIGIIIIDDDIARLHHKVIDDIRSRKGAFPIIVEIQSEAKKETTGLDPLKDLIKRAIGVDISAESSEEIQKPKI